MNGLVFHVVSGQAFFSGVLLIVLAIAMSASSKRPLKRLSLLASIVGMIAVVVSSTPIPYWCCAILAITTAAWIVFLYKKARKPWTGYVAIVAWLIAVAVEIPYHVAPTLKPASSRSITIIGDSVTAGIEADETAVTWPNLLQRKHDLIVQDISHVGETAASALKRAKAHEIASSVVFIEIGGNDLLGSTSAEQFAIDLDALLSDLSAPDRQLIMLELSLPPFYHSFGYAQRELAAKHNAALVPKRVLLSVFAGDSSTLDSIHLTQVGHQQMAENVWQLIKSAYHEPDAE